ncbi:hypothetical protein J1N35_010360 [Gossypium stocksii]|uniref:Uncharacterized protein n=1 Tax=Gossypium stocksii TaxID=47602 RepID=A0A9D3W0Z1_9ROSI|nr:hypothetical protein J1N35_010360 [Gossypium stocksii]
MEAVLALKVWVLTHPIRLMAIDLLQLSSIEHRSNLSPPELTQSLLPCSMVDVDNAFLLALFSANEFRQAIFSMHLDKASSPDGMNLSFFQHCWPIIGNDIFTKCYYWLE